MRNASGLFGLDAKSDAFGATCSRRACGAKRMVSETRRGCRSHAGEPLLRSILIREHIDPFPTPHMAYVSHVAHSYAHTETLFIYDSCKSMPSFLSAGDARGIVARGRHRSCSSQLTSIAKAIAMNLYTYRLSMLIADAPSAGDCIYLYIRTYSDGGNF